MSENNALEPGAIQKHLLSHAERLRGYLRKQIPPRYQAVIAAEDVLQDVWITAFQSLRPEIDDIAGWLTSVANSRLVDALRSVRAQKRGGDRRQVASDAGRLGSVDDLFQHLQSHEKTPSREIATTEARHAVQIALARLPEAKRQVIHLRHFKGLSHKEVARTMNRTEAAINSLLYRAMEDLRECVGDAAAFFSDVRSADGLIEG